LHTLHQGAYIWKLQVEPIKSGHKITLTYELTAARTGMPMDWVDRQPIPAISMATVKNSPLYAALQAALEDPTFLPAGVQTSITHEHESVIQQYFGRSAKQSQTTMQLRLNLADLKSKFLSDGPKTYWVGGTLGVPCTSGHDWSKEAGWMAQDMLNGGHRNTN
jgi:hypothetical protein